MTNDYVSLLREWRQLREQVEIVSDPIDLVKSFFHKKPTVSFHIDPYDSSRWPEPWQLIAEDSYCEFAKILGICYTLGLTTKFTNSAISIYTLRDKKNQKEFAVLFVDDNCITYQDCNITKKDLTSEHIVVLSHNDMSLLTNI